MSGLAGDCKIVVHPSLAVICYFARTTQEILNVSRHSDYPADRAHTVCTYAHGQHVSPYCIDHDIIGSNVTHGVDQGVAIAEGHGADDPIEGTAARGAGSQ